MKVYAIDVQICATAYIRAENKTEAREKVRALRGASPTILVTDTGARPILQDLDHAGDVPISGRRLDDPKLPDVSLSPAMTIHGI